MEQDKEVSSVPEVALQPTWILYLHSSEQVGLAVGLLDIGLAL